MTDFMQASERKRLQPRIVRCCLKSSLAEINRAFNVLGSEMKLVESAFDKNDKSVEALTARNEVLGKQITAQKEKIEVLRAALKNASDSFGENDRRTQAWQIQLNNAEAALNGMERELKSNTTAIENADKGMEDAGKSTDQFGDEIDDATKEADDAGPSFEGLGTACKATAATIAAAFAAVSAAAVAAGKALLDMSTEGASYADDVLTTATQTGIATDKLQEYMYAAELVDVSTETLTKSMAKQIKSMKAVQDGTALSVAAYEKLGIEVMDAEGNLRNSDTKMADVIGEIIPKVIDVFMTHLPILLDFIVTMVTSLGQAIVDNLPIIVDSATQLIFTISKMV